MLNKIVLGGTTSVVKYLDTQVYKYYLNIVSDIWK